MTAAQREPDDTAPDTALDAELDAELDSLTSAVGYKKNAVPLKRNARQVKAQQRAAEADDLAVQQGVVKAQAAQLAQVVNLMIAGYGFAEIGASIGATADEVEKMLTHDTARYVRSQPALRTYVRNYISGKYTQLLEAVWDQATDQTHGEKLENQDRAIKILDRMAKLHGAEMPTQAEIKVDAAPEAVEKLVQALSQANGLGYDTSIFDSVSEVVPGEVVHDAVAQSEKALTVSGNRVEDETDEDEAL